MKLWWCRKVMASSLAAFVLVISAACVCAGEGTVRRGITVKSAGMTVKPEVTVATSFNLEWNAPDETKKLILTVSAPGGWELKGGLTGVGVWKTVMPENSNPGKSDEWVGSLTFVANEIAPMENYTVMFHGSMRPIPQGSGGGEEGEEPEWKAGLMQADLQADADNDGDPRTREDEVAEQGETAYGTGLMVPVSRNGQTARARLVLSVPGEIAQGGRVRLDYDADLINVFSSNSSIMPGARYNYGYFGPETNLTIEGVSPSHSIGDCAISAAFLPAREGSATDELTTTVFAVDLRADGVPEADEEEEGAFLGVSEDKKGLLRVTADVEPANLPGVDRIRLTRPEGSEKIRVYADAEMNEEIEFGEDATNNEWSPRQVQGGLPLYVQGTEPGTARLNLQYWTHRDANDDGQAECIQKLDEDTLKLTALEVDILRVPEYLFANARYATPVRYRIGSIPFGDIEFESVEVCFYINGAKQITQRAIGRTARVVSGARKALSDVDSDDTPNEYESYVRSSKYRTGQIDLPGNFTEQAHFEVTAEVKIGDMPNSITVSSDMTSIDSDEAVSRFGDKDIAAYDMRPAKLGHGPFVVTKGVTKSPEPDKTPHMVVEMAHWASGHEDERLECDFDGPPGIGGDPGWMFCWWLDWAWGHDRRPRGGSTRVVADSFQSGFFSWKTPSWKAVQENGKFTANPQVRTVYLRDDAPHLSTDSNWEDSDGDKYVIHDSKESPRDCFEKVEFMTKHQNGTYASGCSMKQHAGNVYKGEYIAKNIGNRVGAYLFLSYGRLDAKPQTTPTDDVNTWESPPCLTDEQKISVPWKGQPVPEQAMDLNKVTGNAKISIDGNVVGHASTSVNGASGAMQWIDMGMAGANAVIAVTQPHLGLLTVPAQAIIKYAEQNGTKYTGNSEAKILGFYSWHDRNGNPFGQSTHLPRVINTPLLLQNNEDYDDPFSVEYKHEDRRVGEQVTVWVDIAAQAQLTGYDTAGFNAVDGCNAKIKFISALGRDAVEIDVYKE